MFFSGVQSLFYEFICLIFVFLSTNRKLLVFHEAIIYQ